MGLKKLLRHDQLDKLKETITIIIISNDYFGTQSLRQKRLFNNSVGFPVTTNWPNKILVFKVMGFLSLQLA